MNTAFLVASCLASYAMILTVVSLARRRRLRGRILLLCLFVSALPIGNFILTRLLGHRLVDNPIVLSLSLLGIALVALTFVMSSEQGRQSERLSGLILDLAVAKAVDGGSSVPVHLTAIVIPAFNEEATIGRVLDDLRSEGSYFTIVVDDGSTDQTAARAKAHGADRVLSFSSNLGVGAAIRAGLKTAHLLGFAIAAQVDGDNQHPASSIRELLERPATFVLGSRFVVESPPRTLRGLAIRMLRWKASRSLRTRVTDPTSGFRVLREPALSFLADNMPTEFIGDTFGALLLCGGLPGFSFEEVSVSMLDRQVGVGDGSGLRGLAHFLKAALLLALGVFQPRGSLPRGRSSKKQVAK